MRLSLSVEFPASDLHASDFRASLHTVQEAEGTRGRRFVLQPGERLDRDFVLRFCLAGGEVRTSLAVQPDEQGDEGTFALTLVPPVLGNGSVRPRDVAFVLDRSGSMGGWKMVAARRALARMVESLTERDRFTVLAFDDCIETPPGFDGLSLMPATDRHRFQAAEYLAKVDARNGTEMAHPLDAAVRELSRETGDRDRILVLVTDGQVGNEDQILRNLGKRLRGIRVFTLGIDTAVNAAFLKRLADLGGGASELVESEARLEEVMDTLHRSIGTPVLTNLRLEPAGLEVMPGSVTPVRLPDLFAGAPVLIQGRYRGSAADHCRSERWMRPANRGRGRQFPAPPRCRRCRRSRRAASCANWRTATPSARTTRCSKGRSSACRCGSAYCVASRRSSQWTAPPW